MKLLTTLKHLPETSQVIGHKVNEAFFWLKCALARLNVIIEEVTTAPAERFDPNTRLAPNFYNSMIKLFQEGSDKLKYFKQQDGGEYLTRAVADFKLAFKHGGVSFNVVEDDSIAPPSRAHSSNTPNLVPPPISTHTRPGPRSSLSPNGTQDPIVTPSPNGNAVAGPSTGTQPPLYLGRGDASSTSTGPRGPKRSYAAPRGAWSTDGSH